MPFATSPSNAPAARVPAWQQLGLTLKSVQEIPTVKTHKEIGPSTKKRRLGTDDTPPTKKIKKIKSLLAAEPATPALRRKKSVTFTPETKAEDGDSIKQLFSTWVAEQKAQDPTFQTKTASKVFDSPKPAKVYEKFDTTLDEKERRVKRVEKLQPQPKSKFKDKSKGKSSPRKTSNPTPSTIRPFLAYIRQYHEDRANWKFNKNHQNHVLKNLFDINAVPSEYVPLIYKYIKGLQGGVRVRLRDTALAILVKDREEGAAGFPDDMSASSAEDREKRQQEYEAQCREYVATMTAANAPKEMGYEEGSFLGLSDAAMKTRVAKRTRAEMILFELAGGASPEEAENRATRRDSGLTYNLENIEDDDSRKRVRENDGSAQKVARRRKQRTANVEDQSYSDDSSDSNGTDSGSDDAEEDEGQNNRSNETSSSSSSSSSESGSDDSEEDESDSGSGSGSEAGSEEDGDGEDGNIE
jgi:hypothetical protein